MMEQIINQGNVRVVLDHNSLPVEENSYYPYGGLMAATATEGTQPYKYGGKELDRENGLDLYDSQARWYDPMLARTTTIDPLAEKYYSISPYAWCAGNPVKFIDPDGRDYSDSIYDDRIVLSAHFYTSKKDLDSAIKGCQFLNNNSLKYAAQIKTESGVVEIPIYFNAQAISVNTEEISAMSMADDMGNAYFVKPDESFDANTNGRTVSGKLIKVKECRSGTNTVGHEFGHAMGSTHHGGLMSTSSSERKDENLDESSVEQMVKTPIKGNKNPAGKGLYINKSKYTKEQLKNLKIIKVENK